MQRPLATTFLSFACTVLPILSLAATSAAQDTEAVRSSVKRLETRLDQLTQRIESLAQARSRPAQRESAVRSPAPDTEAQPTPGTTDRLEQALKRRGEELEQAVRMLATSRQELARTKAALERSTKEREAMVQQMKAMEARLRDMAAERRAQVQRPPVMERPAPDGSPADREGPAARTSGGSPIVIHNTNGGSIVIHVHQAQAGSVEMAGPPVHKAPAPADANDDRRLHE